MSRGPKIFSEPLHVRLSAQQTNLLENMARKEGKNLTEMMRALLDQEARRRGLDIKIEQPEAKVSENISN